MVVQKICGGKWCLYILDMVSRLEPHHFFEIWQAIICSGLNCNVLGPGSPKSESYLINYLESLV